MISSTWRTGAALLAAVLAPVALAAQTTVPPVLNLGDAVAIARENNPDLLSQQNDRRVARGATRQARADFIPSAAATTQFGYTAAGEQRYGAQVFGEKPPYYSSLYQLGLSYDLSGAKLLRPSVARANERATHQRVLGQEAALVATVVQGYLSVLQAQEKVAQAEREVARTAEHQRLAQARLDVGAGTPLDLRRAEVQKGQADVGLVQAQNAVAIQRVRLGQSMGVMLPAGTQLSSSFQLFEPRWTVDGLVEIARRNNPGVLAARAGAAAARTQVRAARSQYLPSVSASVGLQGTVYSAGNLDPLYQSGLAQTGQVYNSCLTGNILARLAGMAEQNCAPYNISSPAVVDSVRREVRGANPSFPFGFARQPLTASLTFSLPLFNGLQRERQIEEARVAAEDAQLQVRSQELKVTADIAEATLNLQTAYRTAQLQEQVRQKAAEELRLAQERFRFGAASSVDVTDAQASLAEAERAQIDAVYNYHKSLAALESLVGQSLR